MDDGADKVAWAAATALMISGAASWGSGGLREMLATIERGREGAGYDGWVAMRCYGLGSLQTAEEICNEGQAEENPRGCDGGEASRSCDMDWIAGKGRHCGAARAGNLIVNFGDWVIYLVRGMGNFLAMVLDLVLWRWCELLP
ncbi:hypothetical protein M0R45_015813 [Rubus argutus]|uniref:Uncharacterized protein n=1 Tax=Rubus argutus TaxID=59490 RepID=A0AAW1XT62_RUBAR